jgi:hypothetical protein
MRGFPTLIMLAACLSLIAVQLSGLHMHVDSQGYAGPPEGTHVHGQPEHHHGDVIHTHEVTVPKDQAHPGGKDHAGDKDVSIIKFGTVVSKLLLCLMSLGLILFMVVRLTDTIALRNSAPRLTARHERWWPPLRAPPLFSYSSSL